MMFTVRSTRPCYLVLVRPALVALDIGLTLSDEAPTARIIAAAIEPARQRRQGLGHVVPAAARRKACD